MCPPHRALSVAEGAHTITLENPEQVGAKADLLQTDLLPQNGGSREVGTQPEAGPSDAARKQGGPPQPRQLVLTC